MTRWVIAGIVSAFGLVNVPLWAADAPYGAAPPFSAAQPTQPANADPADPLASDSFELADTQSPFAEALKAPATSGCVQCQWDQVSEFMGDLEEIRTPPQIGNWQITLGGELRHRYLDERFRLRPMGTVSRDTYNLWRYTPYIEMGNDGVTGFVQMIDASSFGEELAPLPVDENRADLLQFYVDLRLHNFSEGALRLKAGRQTLNYGSQLVLSPLGWSNTFRNFEGLKLYYAGENWSVDGISVRPVNGAAVASQNHPRSRDMADQSYVLSSIYASYKAMPFGVLDLYWIWNNEQEPVVSRQDGNRHTFGARYEGKIAVEEWDEFSHTWNWNLEAGWQFGEDTFISGGADQFVSAGYVSANGGLVLDEIPWKPTFKGVFWWGSGDDDPNDSTIHTVNTLFPLGHANWGLIDNFNGANLIDLSPQVSVSPTEKLTFLTAWHWFGKANRQDYIYNIAGSPLGTLGATSSRSIGNELDLVATYQVDKTLQIQVGYFWFFYADAVNNDPTLVRPDAKQFYLMTTLGF